MKPRLLFDVDADSAQDIAAGLCERGLAALFLTLKRHRYGVSVEVPS